MVKLFGATSAMMVKIVDQYYQLVFFDSIGLSGIFEKNGSRKVHRSDKTKLLVIWLMNKTLNSVSIYLNKGIQDCPFNLEAREGYKSALDDITGNYLFDTTESRNNLQVSKTLFWFWT